MKKLLVLIVVVLLGLGLAVGRKGSAEAEHGEDRDAEVFERNVRIGFTMVDDDGESEGHVFIVTAVPKYKMTAKFKNEGEAAMMAFSGAVDILENDQILVVLEAEMLLVGEEGEEEFSAATAVRLKSGHEQETVKMGERVLIVHAEYTD